MSGHNRHGRRPRGSHGRDQSNGRMWTGERRDGYSGPRLSNSVAWIVAIVGVFAWSLVAWIGYVLVDPILGWVAAGAGLMLDGGKDLATAAGEKEMGAVIDNLRTSGLLGQTIALTRMVLGPAIVLIWAIGALALIAAPLVLPKIAKLIAARRH